MNEMLAWIDGVPSILVYLALAIGAAIENVIPAIPADTFVALGGLLSSAGTVDWRWLFGLTWLFNTASALAMYRVGYVHGPRFFSGRWGRRLLDAGQMERMRGFYDRWGVGAVFFTRFLPGLRSVVPVFAGVTHQPALFVALPVALASAIWYGALVWMGRAVGANLALLDAALGRLNAVLLVLALVAVGWGLRWWWVTRGRHDD